MDTAIKSIQVTFSRIKWATDGERVRLPRQVRMTVERTFDSLQDAEMWVADEGANLLSDQHGWLVESFDYKVV